MPCTEIGKYESQVQDFSSYVKIFTHFIQESSLSNINKLCIGFWFAVLLYRLIDFCLNISTTLSVTYVLSYFGFTCLGIMLSRDYIFEDSNEHCKILLTDGVQFNFYTGLIILVLLAFVKMQQIFSKC